jgi:hypothetical protein
MQRIGYDFSGFAPATNTTKGGEDTSNPSSVESKRDSLRYSADGSQVSESDTSLEDQPSNEDGGSTSTEESSDHHFDFPFEFPDEKGSKADTNRPSEQNSGRKSKRRHWLKFFDSGTRTRIYVADFVTQELS